MKKTVLVIAMLSASSAFATSFGSGDTNINTNAPRQDQGQAQGQLQGQAQLQGQGQMQGLVNAPNTRISNDSRAKATAAANNLTATDVRNNNGGNVQNTVVTDSGKLDYSGKYEVKSVPNVYGGNVYPTAPCMGSTTAGASWLGGGGSVGTSWTDDECSVRETARSFQNLGMTTDAVAVLCTSKYAAAAPACKAKE